MKIPDRIYLQVGEGVTANENIDGVTWCEDRIDETDVEYSRVITPGEVRDKENRTEYQRNYRLKQKRDGI